MRVQAACYPPAMQEARAIVAARLQSSAATCAVASDAGGVCGYLFAYPSRLGAVTDLGAAFDLATNPDTLYLHDLSVAPRAHGAGLARALVGRLLDTGRAQGLRHAALVSVQDSARFWAGFGFQVSPAPGAQTGLATYPGGAIYMTRPLHQL